MAIAKPMPDPRELEEREGGLQQGDARDDHREDPSPRLERPEAERSEQPDDPGDDREPTPQADIVQSRQVAEGPEPVEADDPQAEEQEAEPDERREESEDGDEDGWVLHRCDPPRLPAHAGRSGNATNTRTPPGTESSRLDRRHASSSVR